MSGSWILILLTTLLTAALLHPASCAGTSGIARECNALLAFKAGIKRDPQGLLSTWNASTDCCTWFGTLCDSKGYITELDLSPDPAFDDDTYYLKGMVMIQNRNLTYKSCPKFVSNCLLGDLY